MLMTINTVTLMSLISGETAATLNSTITLTVNKHKVLHLKDFFSFSYSTKRCWQVDGKCPRA